MMAELFDEVILRKEDDIAAREEARNEGRIEGKLEASTETALNMLKNGISDDLILKCTGISVDTLETIKKDLTED